jgi:hypothetical protein
MRFTFATVIAILVSLLYFASSRQNAQVNLSNQANSNSAAPSPEAKPYFSLSTVRSYDSGSSARIWLDYRNISSLDFRVYRIKDPKAFFLKLANPHQIGKDEKPDFVATYKETPWLLEIIDEW